jgi:vacuolar protein sorting-associated protein 54
LQAFHQKNLNEAARLVENEQWSPADVTASTQSTITRILDSAVSNPSAWELSKTDPRAGEAMNVDHNEAKASKHAVIEDRTYFSVGSCSRCVDILEEYLKVVINLPLLTLDTMSRIIEFLKVGPSQPRFPSDAASS